MAATLAFWLGNPVLNPATIVFMGFVLGWQWVALRIVLGIVLVFGVAQFAARFTTEDSLPEPAQIARDEAIASATPQGSVVVNYFRALWILLRGLVPEYVVIVLALGVARAWLFPAMNPIIGHSLWLMVVLAIAGTLFVIPTAGEVPIIQTLSQFGLGAGSAGVLLMTLPAVSLPSLVMVGRALPARVLVVVSISVAILGLVAGFLALALHF